MSGNVSSQREIIHNSEVHAGACYITAESPLATMFDYANELRSMSGGRGIYEMTFAHYDTVQSHVAAPLIAEGKKHIHQHEV